jgi:hypothetical protein
MEYSLIKDIIGLLEEFETENSGNYILKMLKDLKPGYLIKNLLKIRISRMNPTGKEKRMEEVLKVPLIHFWYISTDMQKLILNLQ